MGLHAVSLFAGIGGFEEALHRAGIPTIASVEIDTSARGVIADHFPQTRLFNDVTEVTGDQLRAAGFVPDRGILTGGFPCQDLSVAGRRAGLAGGRSGLFWEIDRLLGELHPSWFILENVPGLLSSNGGRDMGAVLRALGERGYGVAYRILDAQHHGVPQRRRRVFIVGHLGDWRGPAQVLLEPESSLGDLEACNEEGQETPRTTRSRADGRCGVLADSGIVTSLSASLGAGGPDLAHAQAGWIIPTLTTRADATYDDQQTQQLVCVTGRRTHALTAEGHDASEDGTGRGTPIVAFQEVRRSGDRINGELPAEEWAERTVAATLSPFDLGSGTRAVDVIVHPPLGVRDGDAAGDRLVRVAGDDRVEPGVDALPDLFGGEGGQVAVGDLDGGGELHGDLSSNLGVDRYDARYADAAQARPRETLRTLREAHGEEEAARWLLGIAAALRPAEVLRPDLHGESVRRQRKPVSGLVHDTLALPETDPTRPLPAVSDPERERRTPPGREPHQQRPLEPDEAVSLLSHAGPSRTAALHGLREAAEGSRVLLQALSTLENMGRPTDGQAQPAHGAEASPRLTGGVGVSNAVRRLTPRKRECERLQGFPDDWTATSNGRPQADSARYKQCGNAVAVPVVEWIARRIAAVDAANLEETRAA